MPEPLSFNTTLPSVDTSRPVPIEGDYVANITNVEGVYAKEDQAKPMWKVTLSLENGAQAVPNSSGQSKSIPPGYLLTENVLMYQPENPKAPDFAQRVAKFYDACMGTNDDTRPADYGDLRPCMGKRVIVKLKPEESGDFGLQVRIKKFSFLQG